MSITLAFRKELQFEAHYTRQLLAVIPEDKMAHRPVGSGFSVKELAIHVADLMNWVNIVLNQDAMNFGDLKSEPPPYDTAEKLVAFF